MPVSELMQLAQAGKYEPFETRCLELLEQGQLTLAQLAAPFEQAEKAGQGEQLGTLALMVFDNVDVNADPPAALELAKTALIGAPRNEDLRKRTIELYRLVYGHYVRFNVVLDASGLSGGRPVRMALKLLDLCLALQPGDTLISRMDDHVVEVTEIDRERGLFTLRHAGRVVTRPAEEIAREFDPISAEDFRVLRQLRPEKLADLIEHDPVKLVIGLIRAHGGHIDADQLKHELAPKYIEAKEWSKWWTRARNELKRSPHVTIEGRAPVILSYNTEARTLESETWERLQTQKDALDWMSTIEGYLREQAARHQPPDAALLQKFHEHFRRYITAIQGRRRGEALTCALVLERLGEKGLPVTDEDRGLAVEMLRTAEAPGRLLEEVPTDALRERALQALQAARPADWTEHALAWLPRVPAAQMDKIATAAIAAGHTEAVQTFVDAGLSDLAHHPELMFWLWKGPKHAEALKLPLESELFRIIIDTVSALGRTVTAEAGIIKQFRERVRAALALRDYARARKVIGQISEAAAVTLRWQIQRIEGLGENVPARLLDILRDVHPQLWVVKPKRLAPWEDPETIWTTAAGLAKRTAERDELVNVKMPENARKIGEAAAHGDLSENSEYKFALEERDLLRARLARINEELSLARALDARDVVEDRVVIGSRVTLRSTADGSTRVMTFLGPFDTDTERNIFSYQAPVSRSLMGKALGERVKLTLDGVEQEFEIAGLKNAVPHWGPPNAGPA